MQLSDREKATKVVCIYIGGSPSQYSIEYSGSEKRKVQLTCYFFKIILFSTFVIFNNFHKQHKCNNRLTNNSINAVGTIL